MNTGVTNGLVLKTADFGESDKLITFYSKELGKITGLAKGAKLSKKRFVNKLEQLSLLSLTYKRPRTGTLFFIQEAELERAHLSLRQTYDKYVAAVYLSELIMNYTRERDPDPELYYLLKWAFTSLDRGERTMKIAALFHVRLLTLVGYQPEFTSCSHCHSPVNRGGSYNLLPGNGALLCNRCRPLVKGQGYAKELPLQTLKFLDSAQYMDLSRLSRLQLPPRTAKDILSILHRYSCGLLQRDFNSWNSLAALFPSLP